jgi:small subunit ribosomal protein S15
MRDSNPEWSGHKPEDVESMVVKLREKNLSQSQIGMVLRDAHGIPGVKLATGKSMGRIIADADMTTPVPEDLTFLIQKALRLRRHLESNHNDIHNKRSLQNCESKIRRLVKYYRRTGTLPDDWVYRPETAELLISR